MPISQPQDVSGHAHDRHRLRIVSPPVEPGLRAPTLQPEHTSKILIIFIYFGDGGRRFKRYEDEGREDPGEDGLGNFLKPSRSCSNASESTTPANQWSMTHSIMEHDETWVIYIPIRKPILQASHCEVHVTRKHRKPDPSKRYLKYIKIFINIYIYNYMYWCMRWGSNTFTYNTLLHKVLHDVITYLAHDHGHGHTYIYSVISNFQLTNPEGEREGEGGAHVVKHYFTPGSNKAACTIT